VFFERGVLDAVCMLDQIEPLAPTDLNAFVINYPYYRQVFCFPPWEAIFTTDTERDQTFADAVRIHAAAVAWYERCGYEVVDVPQASTNERCAFVLAVLARGNV
jgi:predicted ATPase